MAYDIISDIHGCYDEMTALIQKLGYTIKMEYLSMKKAGCLFLPEI